MASLFVGLVWGALTAKGNNHFPNFFSGTQNHDKQVFFFFLEGEKLCITPAVPGWNRLISPITAEKSQEN